MTPDDETPDDETPDGEQSDGDGPDEEKPDWWIANERDREAMDLPAYDPPRFEDGVYAHVVVSDLETTHDCEIVFLGMNVDWGDEWDVLVDRKPAFAIGRSRDDDGNTINLLDSGTFRERIERAFD